MTEDNNDMEVEDILSSIKNILEEDETAKAEIPSSGDVKEEKSEDVVDDVLAEDDVDVIELSDDMRIDDENNINDGDISDSSPLGAAIDELDQADEAKDNTVLESENPVVSEDSSQNISTDVVMESDNISSESVSEIVEEPVAEPEMEVAAVVEEPVADPEVEVAAVVEEPVADPEMEVAAVVEESVAEPEPEVATVVEEPVAESEPEVATVVEEPVVDASANIISNFAKIFAQGKDREENSAEAKVTELGDGSKTLESFVRDAIVKVIGEDIAKEWNNGADYRNMAEAEIQKQVKAWLDENLSKMVEKIIKEEMERVIAKVGSQS